MLEEITILRNVDMLTLFVIILFIKDDRRLLHIYNM
jgi:hypothetical protein